MRLPIITPLLRVMLLLLLLATSGCEVGRSWFSMSSDSSMPWFGVDLMPRRRTSQVFPRPDHEQDATREVATKAPQRDGQRRTPERIWTRELHLPVIPVLFDHGQEEELSFNGPTGPFSR